MSFRLNVHDLKETPKKENCSEKKLLKMWITSETGIQSHSDASLTSLVVILFGYSFSFKLWGLLDPYARVEQTIPVWSGKVATEFFTDCHQTEYIS